MTRASDHQDTGWISVESSNIAEVKYIEKLGFLFIRFHGKAIGGTSEYCYMGVPKTRFQRMLKAKSVGKFFNTYIRYEYPTYKEIIV